MHAAYEVFIEIKAIDSFSPALAAMSRMLGGLQKQFDKLTASQKVMAGVAASAAGAVLGVAEAYKIFGKEGLKLADQQQQMINKGIALNDVLRIQAEYFRDVARAVPTSSLTDHLKMVQDFRGVLGSEEAAERAAPQAERLDSLLGEGASYQLYRAIEKKGLTQDQPGQQKLLDELYPYLQLFKEKVKPADLSNFASRGGAGWITQDIHKTAPYDMALIADLKGDTAGVVAMQMHKFIQGGGVISKQQTEALELLNLVDMKKTTKTGFGGSKTQLGIGAIKGSLQYGDDDPGWVREVLQPAIEQYGRAQHAKDPSNSVAVYEQAMRSKIFPNQNSARGAYMWGDPEFVAQAVKDYILAQKVPGEAKGYQNAIANNPKVVMEAFQKQLESFKEAVGAPLVTNTIPFLRSLTSALTSLGEAANNNPKLATNIVLGGSGAIGGAVGGAAIGALAGPIGMAAGAIGGAAIGGGIGLAVANWDKLLLAYQKIMGDVDSMGVAKPGQSWASTFDDKGNMRMGMDAAWVSLKRGFQDFADWVKGFSIWDKISAMITAIKKSLSDGFDTLAGYVSEPIRRAMTAIGDAIVAALKWALPSSITNPAQRGAAGPGTPWNTPGMAPTAPAIPPAAAPGPVTINNSVNVDGKKVAQSTTSYMVGAANFPRDIGGSDGRGSWQNPGAESPALG